MLEKSSDYWHFIVVEARVSVLMFCLGVAEALSWFSGVLAPFRSDGSSKAQMQIS